MNWTYNFIRTWMNERTFQQGTLYLTMREYILLNLIISDALKGIE
jgi:hypothetical protein